MLLYYIHPLTHIHIQREIEREGDREVHSGATHISMSE